MKKVNKHDPVLEQRKLAGKLIAQNCLGLTFAIKIANYDIDKVTNLSLLRMTIDALEKMHLHLSLNEAERTK